MASKQAIAVRSIREISLASLNASPVRYPRERVGETVNLKCALEQERSLCAMLSEKHREKGTRLNALYHYAKARELTPEECSEIKRLVGWRHG